MKTLVLVIVALAVLALPLAALAATSASPAAADPAPTVVASAPAEAPARAGPPVLRIVLNNTGGETANMLLTVSHGAPYDVMELESVPGSGTRVLDVPAVDASYAVELRGTLTSGMSTIDPASCASGIVEVRFDFEETLLVHKMSVGHRCVPAQA